MPHTLLLAEPRGFCAGVVRAIDVLDAVLDREPPPIYAFHEIVHNRHVVDGFRARGAIFVDEVSEVPEGSRIVFSAHGVSPAVVDEAKSRSLRIIDTTCPLVTRVHREARKAVRDGYDVLLVGHRGHDETAGTLGQEPDRIRIVESPDEVARLGPTERPVFVVTQTTLSEDDTAEVIDEVRSQYPGAEVRNDICYATTNRQLAVRTIAARADLMLVVGSPNSSNSVRLREVAEDAGVTAYRVDGLDEIDPCLVRGCRRRRAHRRRLRPRRAHRPDHRGPQDPRRHHHRARRRRRGDRRVPPAGGVGAVAVSWETCAAVERRPDKLSGAWVFRGTRVPVSALFENLKGGASTGEFLDWFPGVDSGQVEAVLEHEVKALAASIRS